MDLNGSEQVNTNAKKSRSQSHHKEVNVSQTEREHHADLIGTDSEPHWTEFYGPLPPHSVCMTQDKWMLGGLENFQDMLQFCSTVEGAIDPTPPNPSWVFPDNQHDMADSPADGDVSPSLPLVIGRTGLQILSTVRATAGSDSCSLITDTCCPISSSCSVHNCRISTSSDHCPVNAAAHLHLLGESMSLIGAFLEETNKTVCVSSSLSLLLDSFLCALAPLMCLTTQIPELTSCTEDTLVSTLENIVYMMPGL